MLHAFAQQSIPQRAGDDHHQDEQKRFKMQWFLRRHAFPAVKQQACQPLQIVLAALHAPSERQACLGYNYRLVNSFTFPEVLPLCVALLDLPRKAGLPILIGFARPPRP